jgi:hypothetical protein
MNLLDDDDDLHDEHEYGMGSESRSQSHRRSNGGGGPSLSINHKFAEKYDAKKRTEELSKRMCPSLLVVRSYAAYVG